MHLDVVACKHPRTQRYCSAIDVTTSRGCILNVPTAARCLHPGRTRPSAHCNYSLPSNGRISI